MMPDDEYKEAYMMKEVPYRIFPGGGRTTANRFGQLWRYNYKADGGLRRSDV
jgi:hypothetical protein